jgi:hypothetical protein
MILVLTVSFGTTFPNAVISGVLTQKCSPTSGGVLTVDSVTTGKMAFGRYSVKSATGFTINRFDSLDGNIPFFFQAIGY